MSTYTRNLVVGEAITLPGCHGMESTMGRNLIVFVIVGLCIAATSMPLAAETPIDRAERKIVEYAGVFRLSITPEIRVGERMPESNTGLIEAHTTREGGSCVLHFTLASVKDEGTIAHEVCHC